MTTLHDNDEVRSSGDSGDGIDDYYERCNNRLRAAQRRLEDAIAAGADEMTISKLRGERDDAGDTGD